VGEPIAGARIDAATIGDDTSRTASLPNRAFISRSDRFP